MTTPTPTRSSRLSLGHARFVPGEAQPSPPTVRRTPPARETGAKLAPLPQLPLPPSLEADLALAARTGVHCLIVGETGTGKELVARRLHELRLARSGGTITENPFVPVNCGALPEALAESLLFGHERGTFTSARERRAGKFEAARHGILFLDEIQSLSPAIQAKLLRVLQGGEFERLGANDSISASCQVVAATNMPLEILVERKLFRRDLYYRLNVAPLYIPPLRNRPNEFETIAQVFLETAARKTREQPRTLSADALRRLKEFGWPGNLRQLEHALSYAHHRSTAIIDAEHLPGFLTGTLESYLRNGQWD